MKFVVLPGNSRHIQQAEPSLLVVPSHDSSLQLMRKCKGSPCGPLIDRLLAEESITKALMFDLGAPLSY